MKRGYFFTLLIASQLFIFQLPAQDFFIEAGLNFSSYHKIADGKSDNAGIGYKPGYRIALMHESVIGNHFGIMTGLNFTSRGFNGDSLNRQAFYLNIPIATRFYFENEGARNFIMAGPYLEMALYGNDHIQPLESSTSETIKTTIGAGGINKIDAGFVFGFGRQFKVVDVSIQYSLGLIDITGNTSPYFGSFNRSFSFVVAYRLGHGKLE